MHDFYIYYYQYLITSALSLFISIINFSLSAFAFSLISCFSMSSSFFSSCAPAVSFIAALPLPRHWQGNRDGVMRTNKILQASQTTINEIHIGVNFWLSYFAFHYSNWTLHPTINIAVSKHIYYIGKKVLCGLNL